MKNGDGEIFSDFYETLKIYGENDIISDGFDFLYEDLLDGEFDNTILI